MRCAQPRPLHGRLTPPARPQHLRALPGLRSRACPIKCAAAAAAAVPQQPQQRGPAGTSLWQKVATWFDVGVATVDQQRKPVSSDRLMALVTDMVRKEGGLTATACVFMVAASLFELAIPHFTSKCVFSITKGAASPEFHSYIAALGAMSFGYAACAAARGALFSIIQNRLARQLRFHLFGVLMREESSFHDTNEPGQLTSRLTSDCNAICRCIATNVNVALRNSLQVIGGILILFNLSPQLSGVCLAVFAVHWLVTLSYGSYSRYSQRVAQDMLADSTQCASEAFSSARIVRTFGTEAVEERRYDSWLKKLHDIGMRQAAAWGMYVVLGITAQNGCLLLALLMGGAMAAQGTISPEQVTSFMFYVQLVTHASANVCDQYGAIMEAVGASERVLSHLDDPPAPQIAPGTIPDDASLTGKVTFEGVSYRYPTRPEVLAVKGVDLTLAPGKLTALVGGSGSGKSTLVSLLQRLADPTEGWVKLDEHDLREVDAGWYRSRLGVVAQEPRLFSMSVRDNIMYGCSRAVSDEEVVAAAQAANAHEFIAALPSGYNTLVTDKMLSGGQRQRIALARALVRRPALLLLDEATSALDSESEAAVQKALDEVMKAQVGRTTMLVIAHRLSTVRNADHIVVLDKGQVAEQGTHVELLALRGIYYRLVKRQEQGLTVADRDLSPCAREPPNMSSFEEYDSLRTATSSSLLNASVSLSSVSDAQMPPGEPMVVHGSSSSSSGSGGGVRALSPPLYPAAAPNQEQPQQQQQAPQQQPEAPGAQQQQAPRAEQQQQQAQVAEGAMPAAVGVGQGNAPQVHIVAQQVARANAITSSAPAEVPALTAAGGSSSISRPLAAALGEPLLTQQQQRGRPLTRSTRWGTQRPATPAGNTPGAVAAAAAAAAAAEATGGAGRSASPLTSSNLQEGGSVVNKVVNTPSGTASTPAAPIAAASRSSSPGRPALQLLQQQQQQSTGSSMAAAAALRSPPTAATLPPGFNPVAAGAVASGPTSAQTLQNDIVPVPKGMVGASSSSNGGNSSGSVAGTGASGAAAAAVVVEGPVGGGRGPGAGSSTSSSGAQQEVVAQ